MEKPFFYKSFLANGRRQSASTPSRAGRLADLYLALKHGASVIDTSLVEMYLYNPKDPIDYNELEEKRRLFMLAEAKALSTVLSLPRWKQLPPELKQLFKSAACSLEGNGVALSCDLGWTAANKALANPEAAARTIARKIRAVLVELGAPLSFVLILEFSKPREYNPELHVHGVLSVPEELRFTLVMRLRKALARDYRVGSNRPVDIRPIYAGGGWAAYMEKTLKKTRNRIENPMYATHEASRLGVKLYEDIRRWIRTELKRLPDEELMKAFPAPTAPPADHLLARIQQHKVERKARRAAALIRSQEIEKQAKADPVAFRQKLAEAFSQARVRLAIRDDAGVPLC